MRQGIFGSTLSATYARAVFTASDDCFTRRPVPMRRRRRPRRRFVLSASAIRGGTGRRAIRHGPSGGFGARCREGGRNPGDVLDALAAASWRAFELSLNGMNLLDRRYYDLEYVYSSNSQKSPTLPPPSAHVLVAPPTSVFLTLKIRLGGPADPQPPSSRYRGL